ncbi:MAG: phosphate signaling complex protein PhoU [Armatimonadetes bacterium]|nr:phosphate signaling complex protein PhoU [Armatimonadota bacterium]
MDTAQTTTRKTFDAELKELEQMLLKMGSFVEGMLDSAMQALVRQDINLANEVIRRDDIADEMDLNIETASMRLLALQQPMSKDLRIISTALKIITDLERIGDYSVDIARAAKDLAGEPYFKPLIDLPKMAELTKKMVRDALQAFVERSTEKAEQVCRDDDAVDNLNKALFEELMDFMRKDPKLVKQAAHFILISRYLERIADHVTNVAERIVYMETGELRQIATAHKGT